MNFYCYFLYFINHLLVKSKQNKTTKSFIFSFLKLSTTVSK